MRIEVPNSAIDQVLRGTGRRCSHCQAALTIERTLSGIRLACPSCNATNIAVNVSPTPVTNNPILQ